MYDLKNILIWILTQIFEVILFLWNILKTSRCALLNVFTEVDPLVEVQSFCDYLKTDILNVDEEENKGLPLEHCTYGNFMESLKQHPAYALIYIHDISNKRCFNFCRTTLRQLGQEDFFAASGCRLWTCSWQSREGKRVCRSLRARGFPFLVLIGFKHHRPTILIKMSECEAGPEELKAKLLKIMNDNQIYLDEATLDRQERDEAQMIRLAQDEEYRQSLAADREKERLKKEQEETEKLRIENESKKLSEAESHKEEMRAVLHPEPNNSEDVIKILLRFPNGTRLERRFKKDQSLQQLYAFARLQESCPNDFEILATFPRRPVPCSPTLEDSRLTFQEFKFGKTETLFINEV